MKLDRLLGILTLLLRSDAVTAPMLAERFEVSRRTIGRDVDALCQAGIPVVTRQGGGGGISIAEGFKLDKSVLTADELASIIAALKGIGSVSEKPHIERTLDKLCGNSDAVVSLREPVVIDLASHYKGSLSGKIGQIKEAILARRVIEFDYYYEKGQMRRHVEPAFVVFQWTAWYVFGYCLDRADFRLFKLQRMWDIRATDTVFTARDIPPERRGPNTGFPDDKPLVALFEPTERYKLIETYGLDCYTEMPDGRLRLEIGYTNRDFMIAWLLSFGGGATVLSPADIAADIRRVAEKMVENYRRGGADSKNRAP